MRRHRTPRDRPAYAFILVMLVAFVAALLLGVVMDRHTQAQLGVNRQVYGYRDHHAHAGIREIVNRWLGTARSGLLDRLDEDDMAFSLDMPDGGTIRVFVADGQGSLLTNFDMMGGMRGYHARQAARLLMARELMWKADGTLNNRILAHRRDLIERQLPAERFDFEAGLTRQFGPMSINVNTAPVEVLQAVIDIAVAEGDREGLVQRIIAARREDEDPITIAKLRELYVAAEVSQSETATLNTLIATDSSLFRVVAEYYDQFNVLRQRSGGTFELARTNSSGADFADSGPFLSWERLSVE